MILITGFKGFIGSRLTDFLIEKGYDVIGCDKELTDIEGLRPYFKNAEFVVHLAAKIKEKHPNRKPSDFFEVNVGGTMNVIRLCREYNCKLINISSIDHRTPYGISKAVAEKLVALHAGHQNLLAVTLRLCGIRSKEHPLPEAESYPLEKLVEDIEKIIVSHNFRDYKVWDYWDYKIRKPKPFYHQLGRFYRAIKRRL